MTIQFRFYQLIQGHLGTLKIQGLRFWPYRCLWSQLYNHCNRDGEHLVPCWVKMITSLAEVVVPSWEIPMMHGASSSHSWPYYALGNLAIAWHLTYYVPAPTGVWTGRLLLYLSQGPQTVVCMLSRWRLSLWELPGVWMSWDWWLFYGVTLFHQPLQS